MVNKIINCLVADPEEIRGVRSNQSASSYAVLKKLDNLVQIVPIHLISSLNLGGRRCTTDDVATIPFHLSLSSAALRESPNPIPVHSLMLSSHLFFCLPLLLAPFTVPGRIVFAMPEDLEMWPYHLSFRFFTMVRRSSCTPIAFWILLRTSSFVTWSLWEMFRSPL